MNKYIDKINKIEYFIVAVTMIIYLEPQIFKEDSSGLVSVDYVYKILKIACTFAVLLLYIYKIKKSNFMLWVVLLQFIGMISTLVNRGAIFRFIGPSLTIITMVMIVELLLESKKVVQALKCINVYFMCIFIINIISMIFIDFINNSLFGGVYFLGIDNRFIFTFLPWVVSEGIVSIYYDCKLNKRWFLIASACELVLLYKFSVAAMFAFAIFIVFYFLYKKINIARYSVASLCTYLVLNIAVVFLKVQNVFTFFIQKLGKDITFGGRTYFWDAIIKNWKHFFVIGGGMQPVDADKMFFYNSTAPYYLDFCKVVHAHNYLMTLFYRSGIISIIIFILILYIAMKKLKENSNSLYAGLLLSAMIVFFITAVFDTTDFAFLYFIIALSYYVNRLETKEV